MFQLDGCATKIRSLTYEIAFHDISLKLCLCILLLFHPFMDLICNCPRYESYFSLFVGIQLITEGLRNSGGQRGLGSWFRIFAKKLYMGPVIFGLPSWLPWFGYMSDKPRRPNPNRRCLTPFTSNQPPLEKRKGMPLRHSSNNYTTDPRGLLCFTMELGRLFSLKRLLSLDLDNRAGQYSI